MPCASYKVTVSEEYPRRPDLARVDRDPETKPNKGSATTAAAATSRLNVLLQGGRTAKQPACRSEGSLSAGERRAARP